MGNKHKNFEVIDAHLPRGKPSDGKAAEALKAPRGC